MTTYKGDTMKIYKVSHKEYSYMFAYVLAENEEQAFDVSFSQFVEELSYDPVVNSVTKEDLKAELLDELTKPKVINFFAD